MELWIRSQKNHYVVDRLIKVSDIVLEYGIDERCWIVVNNDAKVAYYHSEKRALAVLDEIQDLMRSLTDSDLKIIQYEMSKE